MINRNVEKGMQLKKEVVKPKVSFDLYFLIISTVILCPLIYSQKTIDPTLAPRLFFFSVIIFFLAIILARHFYSLKFNLNLLYNYVFLFFALYVIISLISLIPAINPAEGLYDLTKTYLSLLLLVFATFIFWKNNGFINVLVKTLIISSFIACFIGIIQFITVSTGKTEIELYEALYEVKGLMAHKNFFATHLFLMLPFNIYGIFYLKKYWQISSIISFLLLFTNIIILQSRAIWLATFVFIIITVLLVIIYRIRINFNSIHKKIKIISYISTILLIILCSIYSYKNPEFFNLIKFKITSIYNIKSDTNKGRIDINESTIEMIKEHPILGVGVGNWKINFPNYYAKYQGVTYDNWRQPHNDFLWILSEKGIFGFLFYILVFISVIFYGIKILTSKPGNDIAFFTVLLLAGIGGYLINALFSFPYDRIENQIFLILSMSGIIALHSNLFPVKKFINARLIVKFTYVTMILSIFFCIYYSSMLYTSNIYTYKLTKLSIYKDPLEVVFNAHKGFSTFTTLDQANGPFHRISSMALLVQKKYPEALIDLNKSLTYHPNHWETLSNMAAYYGRTKNYNMAISFYKKALKLYPFSEESIQGLSLAYFENGNYSEAYTSLLKIYSDKQKKSNEELMKKIINKLDSSI